MVNNARLAWKKQEHKGVNIQKWDMFLYKTAAGLHIDRTVKTEEPAPNKNSPSNLLQLEREKKESSNEACLICQVISDERTKGDRTQKDEGYLVPGKVKSYGCTVEPLKKDVTKEEGALQDCRIHPVI